MAGPTQLPSSTPDLMSGDSDWDTTFIVHEDQLKVALERRHSGWEAVERKWMENNPPLQPTGPKAPSKLTKEACEFMAHFPYPQMSIPQPQLDFDFRMKVVLNTQSASVAVNDGFKQWTTISGGMWSGHFGYGVVVSGGQDSQDSVYENTVVTQIETSHRLQTKDEPPAFIECKTRGNRAGSSEVMKALQDPETAGQVDPRLYQYRVFITMKTSDERYAKLNTAMWIGSCMWKGLEVVCDAYRLS
ncbi:hypothetical protein F4819DRAFT_317757 [Hypoxylon fuscum]|nr:hypothetical protein F4819DRAFT_317757 [Hypoxylon fuscum]